ncbi:uncharacterized protein (TIGR02117 family) [Methylohalomonas lacus]|uniref:Uncharacterized protein (TIGR02117 family) n=1 Tax=Methylohalomonas lacus TaxID=398773 RepID=A0AAE3L464_9GAMM|nr:TIGR02117 family protein [Methylohalomonas lacus]MCS3903383.1 uncharacterized protein (TIGR02117 family) [Methylohalomonas lacus]
MHSILKHGRHLIGPLLLSLLAGCAGAAEPRTDRTAAPDVTIYVVSHGWHTGIVIPARQPGALAFLEDHFPAADATGWYEIGWGDRRFYQAGEGNLWLTLRAGLLPTASALHVVALPSMPGDYFRHGQVVELTVSEAGYRAMIARIADSFSRDNDDHIIEIGQGLYGNSRFFAATGLFHAFNNCNRWTAVMLKEAGVPLGTFMVLTADDVMEPLQALEHSDTIATD